MGSNKEESLKSRLKSREGVSFSVRGKEKKGGSMAKGSSTLEVFMFSVYFQWLK